jgi:hypothetical protein
MLAASNAGAHAGRCGGERFDIAEMVSLKVFGRLFAHGAKAKSTQFEISAFGGEGAQEAKNTPSLCLLCFLCSFPFLRYSGYKITGQFYRHSLNYFEAASEHGRPHFINEENSGEKQHDINTHDVRLQRSTGIWRLVSTCTA